MKKVIVTILILVFAVEMQAQKREVGLFFGGANGITDVGRTDYINPFPRQVNNSAPSFPLTIGFVYRHNLNPQQGLRFNLTYAHLLGNDRLAAEDYRFNRGAKYTNNIFEASLVYEYNFFPINSEQERAHSPYIFAGLGAFAYNHPKYTVSHSYTTEGVAPTSATDFVTTISKENEKNFAVAIPFGAGYKYKFNYKWVVSAEIGVRATFIDGLDMANAQAEDFSYNTAAGLDGYAGVASEIESRNQILIEQRNLGDTSAKDWYVFSGLTFTYTFGRPPCYCD